MVGHVMVVFDLDGVRGTEYMAKHVSKNILPKCENLEKYNWILLPGKYKEAVNTKEKNIIWCHIPSYDMPEEMRRYFTDPDIIENTIAYILQSNFHKNDILTNFNIDSEKLFVLNNAFEPIQSKKKNSPTLINMIYTSQKERGLDILLESFAKIKDNSVILTIHSCMCSDCLFVVNDFMEEYGRSRVNFVGFTEKETYRNNLAISHLLAYPCTFEETACIGVMEAMSAGLKILSTDIGALKETTGGYAKLLNGIERNDKILFGRKRKKFIKSFTKEIKTAIQEIRNGQFDPTEQVEYINNRFSWENIEKQWLDFDKAIANIEQN
jgi:glycosyltransferase involved in cell wall biosynthesis